MNIREFYKNLKYWQKGLFVGVFIWLVLNMYYMISTVQFYDGQCGGGTFGFFTIGPPSHSCSLFHYLFLEPFEDNFRSLIIIFELLLYTVPLIIIGYIVDLYKRRKQRNTNNF